MGERYPAAGAAKEQAARDPAVCEQAGDSAWELIYSIMETAKESGLKPFEYFQHLLEELPQIDRSDKEKLKIFMPYVCMV